MQKETVRTLGQIKNLMEQQNQYKRYMKVAEATRNYQLDRRTIINIALECGALYKINTITLIEMDAFETHFKEKYMVRQEDR